MAVKKIGVPGVGYNDTDEKMEKLKRTLALFIKRAGELLKENAALIRELEQVKKQRDGLRQYYNRSQKEGKIPCDRDKAMVVYGEIDMNEIN